MAGEAPCVFCEIVAGTGPASVAYEDEIAVAALDLFPLIDGHVLVIPRRHFRDVRDVDESVAAHIFAIAVRVGRALYEAKGLKCDGVGISHASGQAAGQNVFHFHVHVRPRFTGDAIPIPPRGPQAARDRLDAIAQRLAETAALRRDG